MPAGWPSRAGRGKCLEACSPEGRSPAAHRGQKRSLSPCPPRNGHGSRPISCPPQALLTDGSALATPPKRIQSQFTASPVGYTRQPLSPEAATLLLLGSQTSAPPVGASSKQRCRHCSTASWCSHVAACSRGSSNSQSRHKRLSLRKGPLARETGQLLERGQEASAKETLAQEAHVGHLPPPQGPAGLGWLAEFPGPTSCGIWPRYLSATS